MPSLPNMFRFFSMKRVEHKASYNVTRYMTQYVMLEMVDPAVALFSLTLPTLSISETTVLIRWSASSNSNSVCASPVLSVMCTNSSTASSVGSVLSRNTNRRVALDSGRVPTHELGSASVESLGSCHTGGPIDSAGDYRRVRH